MQVNSAEMAVRPGKRIEEIDPGEVASRYLIDLVDVGLADTGRRCRLEQTRPAGAIDPINAMFESFPENSVPLEDPAHGAATPSVRARDITTVCG